MRFLEAECVDFDPEKKIVYCKDKSAIVGDITDFEVITSGLSRYICIPPSPSLSPLSSLSHARTHAHMYNVHVHVMYT